MLPFASAACGLNNGLGRTPAMGWNAWNSIRCEGLNEVLIREACPANPKFEEFSTMQHGWVIKGDLADGSLAGFLCLEIKGGS